MESLSIKEENSKGFKKLSSFLNVIPLGMYYLISLIFYLLIKWIKYRKFYLLQTEKEKIDELAIQDFNYSLFISVFYVLGYAYFIPEIRDLKKLLLLFVIAFLGSYVGILIMNLVTFIFKKSD